MNRSQRIVMVIGWGVALTVFGQWISNPGTTWFGYAPLSQATFAPADSLRPWTQLVAWLVLIVVWTASSWWLLRERSSPTGRATPPDVSGDPLGRAGPDTP